MVWPYHDNLLHATDIPHANSRADLRILDLPSGLPFEGVVPDIADDDSMFDGRSGHYVSVGVSAATLIQRAVQGMPAPRRILDMPCGHGRVTRMLRALYPAAEITVCDLDRSGVDFSASHFGARGIYSQDDFRGLDFGEHYDLIWVGSLITHLSEQQTRRFLDFAVRHLAPEGTLVITAHGSFVAQRLLSFNYGLTDAAARGLLADAAVNGYGYRDYPGGDGYGLSLTRPAWFEDLFADGPLRIDGFEEQGWDDHQDVLVLRPRRIQPFRAPGYLGRLRQVVSRRRASLQPIPLFGAGGAAPVPPAQQSLRDDAGVTGFDEAWYLASDPKVASAVAAGLYRSGLDHYLLYGWREARPFCDPALLYDARPRRASALAQAGTNPNA